MLNFKKGGIFSRRTGEPVPEPENSIHVLAVWGSPGSGKSTVL